MIGIGFTGTRFGMTAEQMTELLRLIQEPVFDDHETWVIHHGDCVGADAEFHMIMTSCIGVRSVIHPGPPSEFTANCKGDERRQWRPHMRRNADIVAESDVMIAAPAEMTEQDRGGTWSTVRMARKAGKPLAIVYPDGSVSKERWP